MMEGKLLDNVARMSAGSILRLALAAISMAIYVRVVGLEGYASVGIVFSLYLLLGRLDTPFSFGLIKARACSKEKDESYFKRLSSLLLGFVLWSNIMLAIILVPLTAALSFFAYSRPELFPLYLAGLGAFLISRVNNLLKDILRSHEDERLVQRAAVPSLLLEFSLSLFLLLALGLGVLSLFLASLVKEAFESLLLRRYSRRYARLRPQLSLEVLKALKEYSLPHYITRSLSRSAYSGGLLVSSFFLGSAQLGVLSIAISLMDKLSDLVFPIKLYLSSFYNSAISDRRDKDSRSVMISLSSIGSLLFMATLIGIMLAGKPALSLYLGRGLGEMYLPVILMLSSLFLRFSAIPHVIYLFTADTKLHHRISALSVALLFAALLSLAGPLGLAGCAIAYLLYHGGASIFYLAGISLRRKEVFTPRLVISTLFSMTLLGAMALHESVQEWQSIPLVAFLLLGLASLGVQSKRAFRFFHPAGASRT